MHVRDSLRLDHFYFKLSESAFAALLPLREHLQAANHEVVQVEGGSWEGLYIFAANGSYLELFKGGEGIGLALSTTSQSVHASRIRNEFPWLPWTSGLMKFADGQPWFEWQSTTPELPARSCLETWTMAYFLSHNPQAKKPKRVSPTITRFKRAHFLIGAKRFDEIRRSCEWAPGENFFGDERCILKIPAKDGSIFEMEFEKISRDVIELKEFEFLVRNDVLLEPTRFGSYQIEQRGAVVSLFQNPST